MSDVCCSRLQPGGHAEGKGPGVADQVMGNTDEEEEEQEEEEVVQEPEVEVAKPELTTNLSGSVTYKVGDTAKALTVEATTTDGGTITYQWYQSSTNKNGGGTPIDGATENTYVPSTKEEGTMYYMQWRPVPSAIPAMESPVILQK